MEPTGGSVAGNEQTSSGEGQPKLSREEDGAQRAAPLPTPGPVTRPSWPECTSREPREEGVAVQEGRPCLIAAHSWDPCAASCIDSVSEHAGQRPRGKGSSPGWQGAKHSEEPGRGPLPQTPLKCQGRNGRSSGGPGGSWAESEMRLGDRAVGGGRREHCEGGVSLGRG